MVQKSRPKIGSIIFFILLATEIVIAVCINLETIHARKYQKQISLGDKFLEELDYENAELCYRKAIQIDEKKAEPYIKLADTSAQQGDYNRAREVLQQARENISETSEKKQELLTIYEENINNWDPQTDDIGEDVKNSEKEKKDENTKDTNSQEEAHKIAKEVLGCPYIGNKEYELSYIKKLENSEFGSSFPSCEFINERGYICAQQYDFDHDGQDEILTLTLEGYEDTYQYLLMHMLEKTTDGKWDEAASLKLPDSDSGRDAVASLSGIPAYIRIDVFMRENENNIPDIYVESYSRATCFVDGEAWGLTKIQYQENILSVVGIPVQTAGSDIPAEMTLDVSKSPIEFNTYAEEFIKNFYENKLNAPSSLGYFTPLVYEDPRLIYIVGCRKSGIVEADKALEWQKGNEEKLPGLQVVFRDYTGKDRNRLGKAGAIYTEYVKEKNPDAWYVIVDLDEMPVLLIANSTNCEEKSWLEWKSYAESADIYILNNGEVMALGQVFGADRQPIFYVRQNIVVKTDTGAKKYRLVKKKLVEEEMNFENKYIGIVEFHKLRTVDSEQTVADETT